MADLKDRIDGLRKAFEDAALKAGDARSLEDLRTAFLGRKRGHVTLLFEDLRSVPAEERREAGRLVNEFKSAVVDRLQALEARARTAARPARAIDLTLPGRKRYVGTPHPLTLFQAEIERIFLHMGFTVEEGPEIETDYYNFEALNFPPYHPARDKWDTLFIKGDLLLRTHTSPVQVRVMERSKPPIRIICPGRVFRRDEITMRKSPAAGWRRTRMRLQLSSISTSIEFTRWSSSITRFISATSPEVSDSTASRIWLSTRPPICSTRARTASSSASNCFEVCSLPAMIVP